MESADILEQRSIVHMTKKRIAFIGTGVMGASIIKHLLKK